MKPVCPRPHVWPFAALPAAGLIVLVAASAVLAKDRPSASATQAGTKPGLAIRQEHLAPNDSSFRPIAVRPPTSREMDRMITFEVKIISLDAEPWRDLLKDRMKLMKQEADVCAWMIDAKALTDLLNLAQADATSNVLQAPRVTALENATATIVNEHKQYFVAQMERTGDLEKVAFHPIVVAIDIGMRMNLIGKLQPEGIQLSVDLQDSDFLAMHTLHRKERLGEKIFAASYQVPTRVYKCCRVTYNVPENSSLVISLGLRDRQAKSSNAAAAASELLELVGLPPVPARSVTCERLVVITPRRLSLEADNRPKARTPTVAAKPGVR